MKIKHCFTLITILVLSQLMFAATCFSKPGTWAYFEERLACQEYLKYWTVKDCVVFEDGTTWQLYNKASQEKRDCDFDRNLYYHPLLNADKIPIPRDGYDGLYKLHDGYGVMKITTVKCGPKNKLDSGDEYRVNDYGLFLYIFKKCKRVLYEDKE